MSLDPESVIPGVLAYAKANGLLTPKTMTLVLGHRDDVVGARLLQRFAPASQDNTITAILPRDQVAKVVEKTNPTIAEHLRKGTVPAGHICLVIALEGRLQIAHAPLDMADEGDSKANLGNVHLATSTN